MISTDKHNTVTDGSECKWPDQGAISEIYTLSNIPQVMQ